MEFKGNDLFISGLREDLKEPEFIEELIKLGVTKIPQFHFPRNTNGAFKGAAVIKFINPEEAAEFKRIVNYKLIRGKICWITLYNSDRSFKDKKFEKCNLFIKLSEQVKPEEADALLSKYGEIFSLKLRYGKDNKSQGYGYVCYVNPVSAERALKESNKGIKASTGSINMFEFKPFKDRNPEGLKRNNLLVKNIDPAFTDKEFKEFVSKFGLVTSVKVAKDKDDDKNNKGYGFACFATIEAAEKAMKALNDQKMNDKPIISIYLLKKEERKNQIYQLRKERLLRFKDKNIYVKNLPLNVTDADLVSTFSEYGKVTSARVFLNKMFDSTTNKLTATSRGFGFVCFEQIDQAAKMVSDIMENKRKFFNAELYAAIAESKSERQKKFMKRQMRPPMYPMPMQGMPPHMQGIPMQPMPMPMQAMQIPGMPGMPPMGQRGPFMWDPYNNMPMPIPQIMMERPMMPPTQFQMPMVKTKQEYAQMDKNQLGELIYERVMRYNAMDGETAGKITGMILEMEINLITDILVSPKEFDETFQEALKTLHEKK